MDHDALRSELYAKIVELGRPHGVTHAEAHVLARVGMGWTNQQIAAERRVSIETIKTQLASAMHKLGLHRRAELLSRVLWHSLFPAFPSGEEKRREEKRREEKRRRPTGLAARWVLAPIVRCDGPVATRDRTPRIERVVTVERGPPDAVYPLLVERSRVTELGTRSTRIASFTPSELRASSRL